MADRKQFHAKKKETQLKGDNIHNLSSLERKIPLSLLEEASDYIIHGFVLDGVFHQCDSYRDLPYLLLSALNRRNPELLEKMRVTKEDLKKHSFVSKYTFGLVSPKEIDDGIYIEMKGTDGTMLDRAKRIIDKYKLQPDSLLLVVVPTEKKRTKENLG